MKNIWIGVLLILGFFAVALLAPSGQRWLEARAVRGDENRLLSRLDAYWQGRVDGDAEAMAKYHHPLQTGLAKPTALITESYEVLSVEIDGDEAIATLTIKSRLNLPGFSQRTREVQVESKWVRYEDDWYQTLRPTDIGEMLRGAQQRLHPEAASDEPVTSSNQNGEEVMPDTSPVD